MWRGILETAYRHTNPQQLKRIDALMQKYHGREQDLLKAIVEKHWIDAAAKKHPKEEPEDESMSETAPASRQQQQGSTGSEPVSRARKDVGSEPTCPEARGSSLAADACRVCGAIGHWGNECPTVPPCRKSSIEPPWKRRRL